MSGSNGPFRYPGGQPVASPFGGDQNTGQHTGVDPAANTGHEQQRYYDSAQAAQDPFAQPQAARPQPSYAEHSPRPPRQPNAAPPAEYAPAQQPQGNPYQPTFDPQAPHPQGHGGTDPRWTEAPSAQPTGAAPQYGGQHGAQHRAEYGAQDFGFTEPSMAATPQTSQPGFGHQPDSGHASHTFHQPTNPYASAQPQQAAPSGYDFGAHHGAPTGSDFSTAGTAGDPGLNWGDGSAPQYADEQAFSGHQDFAFQDPGMGPGQQPVAMEHGLEDDDEYEYEDDEGYGRGRKVLIMAALAGAIVVGGGVAYGYQALFSPVSGDAPPVVKSAEGPSKIKPSDPGGRKFAHTDSKIMGRLGSAGTAATTDPATGARRVSTLKIGRDGSIVPPSAPMKVGGPRMVSGMTLGDTATDPQAASPTKAAASVSQPPIQMAKVAPVQKINAATPPVAKPTVDIKNSAPVSTVRPKKITKPTETAALPPPKKPVATGPKPTGAGYVAVLASVPASKSSRMNALMQFADMQQKYGSVLASRTPDVQEANLGAKGTYHRLIAGPPGSAQSARSVCNGLKTAGYQDCWVLAF